MDVPSNYEYVNGGRAVQISMGRIIDLKGVVSGAHEGNAPNSVMAVTRQ